MAVDASCERIICYNLSNSNTWQSQVQPGVARIVLNDVGLAGLRICDTARCELVIDAVVT